LKRLRILAFNREQDAQLGVRVAAMPFDVSGIQGRELLIEVARLRFEVGPGGEVFISYLSSILRSASVAPQPVTIGRVVGSSV
jgi:hypothetical protein